MSVRYSSHLHNIRYRTALQPRSESQRAMGMAVFHGSLPPHTHMTVFHGSLPHHTHMAVFHGSLPPHTHIHFLFSGLFNDAVSIPDHTGS